MNTRLVLTNIVLASTFLGGCWGDSGGPSPPAPTVTAVPASAAASTQAYVAFAQTLPTSETAAEPLSLDLVAVAPVSESDDPVALN